MSGRDEILRRIRAALGDRPPVPEVARTYRTADLPTASGSPGTSATALADLLVDRITDYRATVRRCGAAELPSTVATALRERGAGRVVVPADLDPTWLADADGLDFVPDDPPLGAGDLDAMDGVLTTCAVAIAETGTIVLDAGPGQGRRAITLVPDYHLVVVMPDAVVDNVPAAVARLDPVRPLTWISGPSATSDIELDRVEGVHGPRILEVILIDAG